MSMPGFLSLKGGPDQYDLDEHGDYHTAYSFFEFPVFDHDHDGVLPSAIHGATYLLIARKI
jgi:hypothetical protein